jgi:hypothetical protein
VEGRYAAARFYSWSGVLIPKEGSKMAVVCRPARMDDLKRADEIVVASINELTERRGFGKMASSHPPKFQGFSLRDDTEGLAPCHDSNLCEKSTKTSAFGPFKTSYDLRHSVAISSTPDMSQTPYYGGF